MKTNLAPFLAIPFLLGSIQLAAATFPYANDFSGTGANTAFTTETTNAEWALNNGAYRNTYSNSAITPTTASLSVTGAAGNPFTLETQFTVQQTGNFNTNGATLGFGLFASSATFSTTGNSYYLADFQYANTTTTNVGKLRILSLGDATGFTAADSVADDNTGTATLAITTGTTYTLRLEGTYAEGGSLSMTLGLFDAAGTTQIGTFATASDSSPLMGDFFGYRNRIGLGGGTSIIDFDNYSIAAIPEPSTYALLGGIAALGLALAQRRKRR